jgi:hypothetical protein
MSKDISPAALPQHWMHSHEEDTETEMVFRPASYAFPLSRGRRSFELRPDGTLVEHGIAPTDRRHSTQGKWELRDRDELVFKGPGAEANTVMHIISANKDRLVVKK